jgi:hypothetical protein
MRKRGAEWDHRDECTESECVCADPEQPDPVCDCGCPAWACKCEDLDDWQREVSP